MSNPVKSKPPVSADLGYDRSEPLTVPILANIFSILLILTVVIAGVTFYYNTYVGRIVEETQLTPVSQDLLDLRAKEDKSLHSYGIADKAAGTVRIPVARAMELVAAEAKEGKFAYPTASYPVKKAEDAAAAPAVPAAPAAPAK